MNVSLTPELEKLVTVKVESGMYNSASEVIREGLRLLQERDQFRQIKLESLRRDVEEGIKASDEGRVRDGREAMTEKRERLLQMQRERI